MHTRSRRLAVATIVAVIFPAAALGVTKRLPLPSWMDRMMDDPPPAMEQMMHSPEMQRMMESPPPGMDEMMGSSEMQEMMGSGAGQAP